MAVVRFWRNRSGYYKLRTPCCTSSCKCHLPAAGCHAVRSTDWLWHPVALDSSAFDMECTTWMDTQERGSRKVTDNCMALRRPRKSLHGPGTYGTESRRTRTRLRVLACYVYTTRSLANTEASRCNATPSIEHAHTTQEKSVLPGSAGRDRCSRDVTTTTISEP